MSSFGVLGFILIFLCMDYWFQNWRRHNTVLGGTSMLLVWYYLYTKVFVYVFNCSSSRTTTKSSSSNYGTNVVVLMVHIHMYYVVVVSLYSSVGGVCSKKNQAAIIVFIHTEFFSYSLFITKNFFLTGKMLTR